MQSSRFEKSNPSRSLFVSLDAFDLLKAGAEGKAHRQNPLRRLLHWETKEAEIVAAKNLVKFFQQNSKFETHFAATSLQMISLIDVQTTSNSGGFSRDSARTTSLHVGAEGFHQYESTIYSINIGHESQ